MMTNPGSVSRLGLKALYALSLCALCIYIVAGPAVANIIGSGIGCNSPEINSTYSGGAIGYGIGSVNAGSFNVTDPWTVELDNLSIECDGASDYNCSADVPFMFSGVYYAAPFTFYVHLTGSSTDPSASGNVNIGGVGSAPWWVSNGGLSMGGLSFTVTPDGGGFWSVNGDFNVNSLAPGQSVSWGTSSLDFNEMQPTDSAPEPASAVVLVGGLAWIEFLRRKCRR